MSVEEFHDGFPADENFVRDMSRRPEFGNISPVKLMAGIYIKEGSHGLSQIAYKRAHRQDSSTLRINKGEDESMIRNSSAIYFGVSVLAIEDMIIDGYFDQKKVNAVLIHAFSGSGIKFKTIPNPEYEKIDNSHIKYLTKTAIEDKTFASFFENKNYPLPSKIRMLLDESKMYSYINTLILPEYTERVKRLITANEQRKAQKNSIL